MEHVFEAVQNSRGDNALAGGGEMGRLMREHNWGSSSLGPVQAWPQSLRTAVSICLASRFPIILFWGKGLHQFYNDAYRPILGTNKHPAALGQRAEECWPEIWEAVGPMLHSVLSTGEATWSENLLLLMDRNGYTEEAYFTFSYSPIRDETGEVGGVFCAVTETTMEVLGERRLRLLRALATQTAEASNPEQVCQIAADTLAAHPADLPFALLYLLNANGTTAYLTGAANALLQASPPTIDLSDPDALWPFTQVIEKNQSIQLDDLVTRIGVFTAPGDQYAQVGPSTALILPLARAGEAHPYGFLIAGISPLRTLDEDYRGFLTLLAGQVAIAVTTARAYQDAHERAEVLAELDHAKTLFFSNVSHEFRTPLTLLLGPLETILADTSAQLTTQQREQLEMARRNGLRQLKLVNTLLDFSRIEAGRVEAVYEPTDLATMTRDLASAFRSVIEQAGMRLIVACPALPEPVYVDREMWEKIVLNLLSNAFKFSFQGTIRIALVLREHTIELLVTDTGIGIDETELPHLFERFYRVRGARARAFEGSGIGLSLVQELVRLHGGTIEVHSIFGEGTTFTVHIPRGKAHLPAKQIGSAHTLTSTVLGVDPYVEEAQRWLLETVANDEMHVVNNTLSSTPTSPLSMQPELDRVSQAAVHARLLIVDDNADMRDYLRRLLSASYTLRMASNGKTALRIAREWLPDLILSDVMMQGLDGFDLLATLRSHAATRAIPIILLSARAGEESVLEGLKAGADDYLVKPFSAREMLARVEARLEITRWQRETASHARQLEAILETLTDGIFVYDHTGQLLQMNRAAHTLLALDQRPDYNTLTLAERLALIEPRDEAGHLLSKTEWPTHRLLQGERLDGAASLDVNIRSLDGRQHIISISGAPIIGEDGTITGAVMLFRDVSERRRLEQRTYEALTAILEMAEFLVAGRAATSRVEATAGEQERALITTIMRHVTQLTCRVLNCAGAFMVILAPETEVIEYFVMSGFKSALEPVIEDRVQGQTLAERLEDPDIVARLRAGEAAALDVSQVPYQERQPGSGLHWSLLVPMRLGNTLVGILSLYPINASHCYTPEEIALAGTVGKLAALVIERERLLEQRAQAQANELVLREANRQMDEFLAMAGHEIRTPLTTIKANVQLAQRQLKRVMTTQSTNQEALLQVMTTVQEFLARAGKQIEVQNRLVRDLLDVSRIRAGHLEIRPEVCDVIRIVREAVADQQSNTSTRTIELDIAATEEVQVMADRDRVAQVLNNYLSNALKYSEASKPVSVHVEVEQVIVRVAVRDQGPGLSAEQQQRIWERFYRVKEVEVKSGSNVGLGLGLHISRTIIERLGGQVGVQSVPGEGATFWFTLPLFAAAQDG